VETPRLLLLSRSSDHPDGLANSSGLVGRYFTEHLFAGAGGRLDEPTRQNHAGFNTTESHQFYDDPGAGTEEGIPASDADLAPIKLEFINYAGPSPVEMALSGEDWGNALRSRLRDAYGDHVAMGALVEGTPRRENRVAPDRSRTDDHGNPVPDVSWRPGDHQQETAIDAIRVIKEIFQELGGDITWNSGTDLHPAGHHMGTTRMGTDPDESVVDTRLRTHDVSNLSIVSSSVFVTGGAVNPTLTIVALALWAVEHIDAEL